MGSIGSILTVVPLNLGAGGCVVRENGYNYVNYMLHKILEYRIGFSSMSVGNHNTKERKREFYCMYRRNNVQQKQNVH